VTASRNRPSSRPTGGRGSHEALPHTADVGFRASAQDLAALFEEAAAALAELAADVASDARRTSSARIELRAEDLGGLAFAWLNELIGLSDAGRGPLAATAVERISAVRPASSGATPPGDPAVGWSLVARAWFARADHDRVRPRLDIKSATFHRLSVKRSRAGWSLVAYLDV
jgi:SHS2 domain-containing protein